jgi:hypothetical protein
MKILYAAGVVIVWSLALRKLDYSPLEAIQRGAMYARAASMLAGRMADAAWDARSLWGECVRRARL